MLSKDNGLGPVSLLRDATDLGTFRQSHNHLLRRESTWDLLMVMRASGKRIPCDLPLMSTGQRVASCWGVPCFSVAVPCRSTGPGRGGWGSLWYLAWFSSSSGWLRLAQ